MQNHLCYFKPLDYELHKDIAAASKLRMCTGRQMRRTEHCEDYISKIERINNITNTCPHKQSVSCLREFNRCAGFVIVLKMVRNSTVQTGNAINVCE